ncbi:di-heme oxidoredictase family protein [Tenacibaculum sp. SG-28]|uniref:di-heme oxidoreductase family protein n=1 Tax=Tenacibaculum sp. SG-28 TaxID=754426 RepID=UPI000CF457C6|nr:di-heme oxidoredictase family protein [Tenacibaculum sp. SG-28]PQJ23385.1 thiol oxidoreductase [Tenacibaculum sp. SG-28]
MKKYFLTLLPISLLLLLKCTAPSLNLNDEYSELEFYQDGEELPVGNFTTIFSNNDAFGVKIPGLNRTEDIKFFVGDRLFITTWVPSPASTTGLDGLGPTFNAKSCAGCHFKDGRGKPLLTNTQSASDGFLMRLSIPGQDIHGGPMPVPGYGDQLQNKGVLNVSGEGHVAVTFETIAGTYPDGTPYELRKPKYTIYEENFGDLSTVLTSPRVGTQTIGLGFIDALSAEELLKNADEFDTDGDGISGKPNYVWDVINSSISIGKFGWKANQPSLKQQVAAAFFGDLGLTSTVFKEQNCPSPQQDCYDAPDGGSPEVVEEQLERITFYQSALSVPIRRNFKDPDVLQGKKMFHKAKCISCHAINFKVEQYERIPQIAGTTVNPYSDFLLHDMGEALADNRADFLANGREWRTQPLWGIGLINTVNRHTFLLHDGRARNIEEAILWHGGEAQASKEIFMNYSKEQREQVIKFINTL